MRRENYNHNREFLLLKSAFPIEIIHSEKILYR